MDQGPRMRGWLLEELNSLCLQYIFQCEGLNGKIAGNQVVKGPVCCV